MEEPREKNKKKWKSQMKREEEECRFDSVSFHTDIIDLRQEKRRAKNKLPRRLIFLYLLIL